MNPIITHWLKQYDIVTDQDYENALKEMIQQIALLGLWRSKFFEKAAFYGGTALRILYGLDRFSEDLDFSLLSPDPQFNLSTYYQAIKQECESYGFETSISDKQKMLPNDIQSAFIKSSTLRQDITIGIKKTKQLK